MNSMKFVIPLHLISWIKIPNDAVTPQRQSQFAPKMRANVVPRLLSSLVWIDQYNECNGMTSSMEFMWHYSLRRISWHHGCKAFYSNRPQKGILHSARDLPAGIFIGLFLIFQILIQICVISCIWKIQINIWSIVYIQRKPIQRPHQYFVKFAV